MGHFISSGDSSPPDCLMSKVHFIRSTDQRAAPRADQSQRTYQPHRPDVKRLSLDRFSRSQFLSNHKSQMTVEVPVSSNELNFH